MQHTWLLVLAWTSLAVGIVGCAAIVGDNFIGGYRQPVKVMELVWPVTALIGCLIVLWSPPAVDSDRI